MKHNYSFFMFRIKFKNINVYFTLLQSHSSSLLSQYSFKSLELFGKILENVPNCVENFHKENAVEILEFHAIINK